MGYTNFNMRLDDGLRGRAYPIFEHYGITPSQAVRMFFNQVANTGQIPLSFDWADKIPNQTTINAIKEVENGEVEKLGNIDEAIQAMQEIALEKH